LNRKGAKDAKNAKKKYQPRMLPRGRPEEHKEGKEEIYLFSFVLFVSLWFNSFSLRLCGSPRFRLA